MIVNYDDVHFSVILYAQDIPVTGEVKAASDKTTIIGVTSYGERNNNRYHYRYQWKYTLQAPRMAFWCFLLLA